MKTRRKAHKDEMMHAHTRHAACTYSPQKQQHRRTRTHEHTDGRTRTRSRTETTTHQHPLLAKRDSNTRARMKINIPAPQRQRRKSMNAYENRRTFSSNDKEQNPCARTEDTHLLLTQKKKKITRKHACKNVTCSSRPLNLSPNLSSDSQLKFVGTASASPSFLASILGRGASGHSFARMAMTSFQGEETAKQR